MALAKTHFKLGLFTLAALAAGLIAAFALGARSIRDETIPCHVYFDESVQGLEVGAPVKYRGVTIGSISSIGIAPDQRHVHVELALRATDMQRIGLVQRGKAGAMFNVPPELRAQLGSQGITGVKYLNFDFFNVQTDPPPTLPFPAAPNTIPAVPSLFKSLEDSLGGALGDLPALLTSAQTTLRQVELLVAALNKQGLPERLAKGLQEATLAVGDARRILKDLEGQRLPAKVGGAIDGLKRALTKLDGILDRVDGDDGLVTSAKRATDAVGGAGDSVAGTAGDLDHVLRDISEAAQALRDLAQSLERDPDMLLKGRAPEGEP